METLEIRGIADFHGSQEEVIVLCPWILIDLPLFKNNRKIKRNKAKQFVLKFISVL